MTHINLFEIDLTVPMRQRLGADLMRSIISKMDLSTLQACIDDIELGVLAGVDGASEDLADCIAERDKRLK